MTHSVLASKAIEYKAMGIITLPVDRKTKRALVPYADLSLMDITETYIESHFGSDSKANGIAILNGSKSGVLTLDIDNPELRAILREEHPDLLDTFTEKSPRGYHLIYRISDANKNIILGRRWTGIDLLWKNYVLTAPTEGYQVIEDKAIKILSLIDYLKLCQFFDKHLGIIEEAQNREAAATKKDNEESTQPSKVIDYEKLELEKLAKDIIKKRPSKTFDTNYFINKTVLNSTYNQKRKRLERNESLFQTTLYARDRGLYPNQVEEILHDAFMGDTYGKPYQSDKSRLSEMKRTINSAYLRPARPIQERSHVKSLTDNTREILLQNGMAYFVRTWEALHQAGYTEGHKFTASEAVRDSRGIVGRDSVLSTLKAVFPLSAPIPQETNVAIKVHQRQTNKCLFVRVKKPVKTYKGVNLGGRPEYEYTFLSSEKMAQLVGANDSIYSTPLTKFDLESAKNTRKKLQFSLIDRRPSRYDLIWLADRLGVTEETIRTYNRELGIFSTPQFNETPISALNIDFIFDDLPERQGVFIMTTFGKKYPPFVGIAQRLLMKKVTCSLFIQGASHYSTREPQIKPKSRPSVAKRPKQKSDTVQQKLASKDAPKQKELTALDVPAIESSKPDNEITAKPKTGYEARQIINKEMKKLDRLFISGKLEESDWWEQKCALFFSIPTIMSSWDYGKPKPPEIETWRGMTGIKPLNKPVSIPEQKQEIDTIPIRNLIQGLSERNTKRLIGLYGFKRVLSVSQFVSKRQNVENPAGLLTIILKSDETTQRMEQLWK